MTEMTLDPKTGLPQLPENHFWRVVTEYPGFRNNLTTNPAVSVSIMRHGVVRERKTLRIWPFDWEIHRKGYDEYPTERVVSGGYIRRDHGDDWDDNNRKELILPDEVNADLILGAAKDFVTRWRNQTYIDSLMGDYPPLSLKKEEPSEMVDHGGFEDH